MTPSFIFPDHPLERRIGVRISKRERERIKLRNMKDEAYAGKTSSPFHTNDCLSVSELFPSLDASARCHRINATVRIHDDAPLSILTA